MNKLKDLVGENKQLEVLKFLKATINSNQRYNEVVSFESRYSKLEKDNIDGLCTVDNFKASMNKLNGDLLLFIDIVYDPVNSNVEDSIKIEESGIDNEVDSYDEIYSFEPEDLNYQNGSSVLDKDSRQRKFSFDDETIQSLFGNEAAEDENPIRLKEYYFKSEIFHRIVVDLPIRILVGHKGIGKSALFKIAEIEDEEKNRLAIRIKPDEVSDLGVGLDDFLGLIRNWKVGLSKLILKKILRKFNLKGSLPDIDSDEILKYSLDIIRKKHSEKSLSDLVIPLAEEFEKIKKVNVYIDDLDRGWRGSRKDITRISALLNSLRDIANENPGIQFKISLRSDVYYLVRTSDESTDKIQGSVVWYRWTNNEILILLIKRICTFFDRVFDENYLRNAHQRNITFYLDRIIEPNFRGKGKWDNVKMYKVLMSLIRKRPRDLVKLLTLAARKAKEGGSKIILTEHLEEVFAEYSQDRIQDTINEYKTELPDITRLLFGMKPNSKKAKAKSSYSYTTSELLSKINFVQQGGTFKFASGKKADSKDLANFLYKINFITARKVLDSGVIRRKYFEENRYLRSKFADFGYDWEMHMAYRWALQPDTLESVFDRIKGH